jgi:hypothetical protein
MVVAALMASEPNVYAVQGVNWEALLALIERLLPLILTILSLF